MEAKSVKIVSGNYTYIFNTEKKSNSSHQEMLQNDMDTGTNLKKRDSKIATKKRPPNDSSKKNPHGVKISPFEEMATLGDPGFIGIQAFGGRDQNRMVTGRTAQFGQYLGQHGGQNHSGVQRSDGKDSTVNDQLQSTRRRLNSPSNLDREDEYKPPLAFGTGHSIEHDIYQDQGTSRLSRYSDRGPKYMKPVSPVNINLKQQQLENNYSYLSSSN
jgi:hypothetical protein